MEKNINIPKGWKEYHLGEICNIARGGSPRPIKNFITTDGNGINWIKIGDTDPTGKYIFKTSEKIRPEGKYKSRYVEEGDFLLSNSMSFGRPYILKTNGCIHDGWLVLKDYGNNLSIDFFYYLLLSPSVQQQFGLEAKGSTVRNLNTDIVSKIKVAVPSLTEQSAIVSRIESQFSRLESGIAALQKVQKQLAVYRQAVLKEAFEGCGENVKLGEIATMIDPQPSHRTPAEFLNGIPYVGIGDIDYVEKTIKFNTARKVAPELLIEHKERYTINKGDFVMGKIGTIGKPFLLPLPQNYALSANVILIQPFASKINPFFLYYQFQSPLITKQLNEGATATSQPAFGITKARLLNIKICSLTEQTRIVEQIESRLSVCDSIEKTVSESLRQAEVLRQSILKEAFEGRL